MAFIMNHNNRRLLVQIKNQSILTKQRKTRKFMERFHVNLQQQTQSMS